VGAFPRSNTPQGLVDAAGNCWEWTGSEFRGGHDASRLTTLLDDELELPRAVRGAGFWDLDDPRYLRAAYRLRDDPDFRSSWLGFRLVSVAPFSDPDP
jgi:formylglycine-generating enzyme required for sulfatase activity